MYKNQLQELAQRSCFNLPSYSCIREGPDHAPRFKATVNFNGETFESPSFCTTLRQAEHAAAEVALNALSTRGPSNALAARILHKPRLPQTAPLALPEPRSAPPPEQKDGAATCQSPRHHRRPATPPPTSGQKTADWIAGKTPTFSPQTSQAPPNWPPATRDSPPPSKDPVRLRSSTVGQRQPPPDG